MASSVQVFVEFWVCLVKVLWVTLVSFVKFFIPCYKKKDVSKEIVLVTGAASGIGRLMAMEFAKLGAKVVLWDVNKKGNEAVKKEIESSGGKAYAFEVDLSKREEIYQKADEVCILFPPREPELYEQNLTLDFCYLSCKSLVFVHLMFDFVLLTAVVLIVVVCALKFDLCEMSPSTTSQLFFFFLTFI